MAAGSLFSTDFEIELLAFWVFSFIVTVMDHGWIKKLLIFNFFFLKFEDRLIVFVLSAFLQWN